MSRRRGRPTPRRRPAAAPGRRLPFWAWAGLTVGGLVSAVLVRRLVPDAVTAVAADRPVLQLVLGGAGWLLTTAAMLTLRLHRRVEPLFAGLWLVLVTAPQLGRGGDDAVELRLEQVAPRFVHGWLAAMALFLVVLGAVYAVGRRRGWIEPPSRSAR